MTWGVLIDEQLDPQIAAKLREMGIEAEHGQETIGKGADDHGDIVPYAMTNDLIIVTHNLQDFADVARTDPVKLAELHTPRRPPYETARAIRSMIDA